MNETVNQENTVDSSVCVVCGPPGSGKTTFVQQHLQRGDLVLDMDAIVSALTGSQSLHPDYSGVMDTALSVREAVYKSIESGMAEGKRAFVITSSSDRKQVDTLAQRLHGSVHYMDTSEAECVRRIRNDPTRPDKQKDSTLVKQWFLAATAANGGTLMNETVKQESTTTAAAVEQQAGRTFTQDEVNAIVTERLNRERAKYADYNDLKAKAEQRDAVQAQLDELNRAAARKEMLARVTAATGCPAELLTEETEEACTAQAKAIMKFANPDPGYPIVRDLGDPSYKMHERSYHIDYSSAFRRGVKHIPKDYTRWNY